VNEETRLDQLAENVANEEASPRQINDNPLLRRFTHIPPETFRLPSGGVFYQNGELDPEVVNGEVIVHPMTAVDEIAIRSPDMMFQGTAVEKVFRRCIPQVKKPLELLTNDVDYLLVCLRMVTYGSTLDLNWECPVCAEERKALEDEVKENLQREIQDGSVRKTGSEQPMNPRFPSNDDGVEAVQTRGDSEQAQVIDNSKVSYKVDLNDFIKKTRALKVTEDFTVELPTGEVVALKPSTYADTTKMLQQSNEDFKDPDEIFEFIADAIMGVIKSVDGVTNQAHIREWLEMCEAPSLTYLQEKMHVTNEWGTEFTYNFKCKDCGHEVEGVIPLNPVSFFSRPSVTKTKA
jgi:hypothetical protein